MLIRVDDYPSGSDLCAIPDDYKERLARFKEAIGGAPFCLGVVLGFLPGGEIEELKRDPQIHVAAHGMTHSNYECGVPATVAEMRQVLGDVRPAIIIPPKNMVLDAPLMLRHFDLILTGPPDETPATDRILRPAFYGVAKDMPASIDGLVCLHLGWEAKDGCAGLADAAKVGRFAAARPWGAPA